MKKIISTPKAPAAIGPYNQAILVGNTLFASGQLGIDPKTGEMPNSVEEQTELALSNVRAILEEAGFAPSDVVKTTCFLTDMGNFATMNGIYERFFEGTFPARSAIAVRALPKGGLVEIEVVAVKG